MTNAHDTVFRAWLNAQPASDGYTSDHFKYVVTVDIPPNGTLFRVVQLTVTERCGSIWLDNCAFHLVALMPDDATIHGMWTVCSAGSAGSITTIV